MKNLLPAISRPLFAVLAAASMLVPVTTLADTTATVGGVTYTSKGLIGVGRIPSNQRDKFGETFGSGSGMAIDQAGWAKDGSGYKGTIWLLPDRGYNAVGTTDYRERVNTLTVEFTPVAQGATLLPASETTTKQREPDEPSEKKPGEELNVDAVFAKLKQLGGGSGGKSED